MIRPQQNDEPASQWRSPAAQSSGPGRGDTAPVAATVGVVGGSMSGKGSGVNTGDPWGRTAVSGSRAGVRAIIVAVKRVMIVERRVAGRRTREARQAAKTNALVSAHRVDRRMAKSLLQSVQTSAEHSQNKGWPLDGLPHASKGFDELSAEKGEQSSRQPLGKSALCVIREGLGGTAYMSRALSCRGHPI